MSKSKKKARKEMPEVKFAEYFTVTNELVVAKPVYSEYPYQHTMIVEDEQGYRYLVKAEGKDRPKRKFVQTERQSVKLRVRYANGATAHYRSLAEAAEAMHKARGTLKRAIAGEKVKGLEGIQFEMVR